MMKKMALITGAASGMGYALSQRLVRDNWTVVLTDRNEEQVNAAAKSLMEGDDRCYARVLDVTDYTEINRIIEEVIAKHGRLDLVVNSAGVAIFGEMKDMSMDDWKPVIDVNLWGAIFVTDVA